MYFLFYLLIYLLFVDISKHYIDDFDRFMNKTGGAVLDNIKDCLDVLSNERQKVFNAKNDGEIKRLLDTAGDKTKEYNDNVKYFGVSQEMG